MVVSRSGLKRVITDKNCKFTVPFCRSVCSSSPFIQYYIMNNTSCSICDIGFCPEVEGYHRFHSHSTLYTVLRLPLQSSRVSGKWRRMALMMLRRVSLSNFAPNSLASSLSDPSCSSNPLSRSIGYVNLCSRIFNVLESTRKWD